MIVAVLAAMAAVLYRAALFNGFPNDHYVHLARAYQELAGELPVRDFTEDGAPLMSLVSAGAQLAVGRGLRAELYLVLAGLGAAAGVLAAAVYYTTRSLALSGWAAVLQIAVFPRTYSYPKMLLYSMFVGGACLYAARPTKLRLLCIAALVVIGGLIRHDHGAYLGLGAVALVLATHWHDGLRSVSRTLGLLSMLAIGGFLPYAIWVEWHAGILRYLQIGLELSAREAARTALAFPSLPAVSGWAFFTLAGRPAPEAQAAAVFTAFYAAVGCPLALLAIVKTSGSSWRFPVMCSVAVLGLVSAAGFLRDRLADRLADVYGTLPFLAAVLLFVLTSAARASRYKVLLRVTAITLFVGLSASTFVLGEVADKVPSPTTFSLQLFQRVREVDKALDAWPWPRLYPSGDGWRVARYLRDCAPAESRMIVAFDAPQLHVFADRRFAGGETFLMPPLRSPETVDVRYASTIATQQVSFVVAERGRWDEFQRSYPRTVRYISDHFQEIGAFRTSNDLDLQILGNRAILSATTERDGETGWVCPGESSDRKEKG